MLKKILHSGVYLFLILLSLVISSCDKELLEPEGNRRLKRILDMNGFVKEEWNYNKKGQIESIKSYIRTPFRYYTDDKDEDGLHKIHEGTLNDNPRISTSTYENGLLKEVVTVYKSHGCGCGGSGPVGTFVNTLSYLDNKINQIHLKVVDGGYLGDENVVEINYSPDQSIVRITNSNHDGAEFLFFYDEEKNNIIRYEMYFNGELVKLQYYTHDEKVNPFYKNLISRGVLSLEYWNKNNILTIREKNYYSGIMYHYYGDYPLSSRPWSPFSDLQDWDFFYEYE